MQQSEDSPSTGASRKKHRPLLIAGAIALLVGIGFLVGVYIYIGSTNRAASQAQAELSSAWEKAVRGERVTEAELDGGIARLTIPKIKLKVIVVELKGLDDRADLERGPGHVPGTAYPGQPGNVVISGHRTTFGAPFGAIDTLEPGDKIILETLDGIYIYSVTGKSIVPKNDLSVLSQDGGPGVTLTACHPRYSASQRVVVTGRLTQPRPSQHNVHIKVNVSPAERQPFPQPEARISQHGEKSALVPGKRPRPF